MRTRVLAKARGFVDLGKVITGINFKDGIEQPESEKKLLKKMLIHQN